MLLAEQNKQTVSITQKLPCERSHFGISGAHAKVKAKYLTHVHVCLKVEGLIPGKKGIFNGKHYLLVLYSIQQHKPIR